MSIKTLMSAADAAGYAMVSEENLDDMGGNEIAASQVYPNEVVIVPAQDVGYKAAMQGHVSSAWNWLTGRFVSGAPA